MKYWLIQARDPLIFRDGRPFTADPGARANTLSFPYPSTLAGAARTTSVPAPRPQKFSDELVESLLGKSIRGPLLAAVDKAGNVNEWYIPAPADALLLKTADDENSAIRQWLRPLTPPTGAQTDLGKDALLLGIRQPRKSKLHPNAPAFWHWKQFETWLKNPKDEDLDVPLKDLGLPSLAREYRTHVRIHPDTQTADPGGLFQTSGLEFTWVPGEEDSRDFSKLKELAFVIATDAEVDSSLGFLGGERRVVRWQSLETITFPDCPEEIKKAILAQKHCRLITLTPAIFEDGYLPKAVLTQHGVQAVVKGAIVPRYQTVSGWDYKADLPKATRRMAPAGSVYFLELTGDQAEIADFIQAVWMKNISDDEQKCRDGFGLAVLGTWDGTIPNMNVKAGGAA